MAFLVVAATEGRIDLTNRVAFMTQFVVYQAVAISWRLKNAQQIILFNQKGTQSSLVVVQNRLFFIPPNVPKTLITH